MMWFLFWAYHYFVLQSFGFDYSPEDILTITFTSLALAPPSTATKPLLYQGILVVPLALMGFDAGKMTSYAITLHVPQILWVTILGFWAMSREPKISFDKLLSRDETKSED